MHRTCKTRVIASAMIIVLLIGLMSGCSVHKQASNLHASATNNIEKGQEKAAQDVPVVTTTTAAWLMGPLVQVAPPPSPVLTQKVTYHPAQQVSLAEMASWIQQTNGLVVDTADVQATAASANNEQVSGSNAPVGPVPSGVVMPPFPTTSPSGLGGPVSPPSNTQSLGSGRPVSLQPSSAQFLQTLSVNYTGPLSGLLDIAANKLGVWWKMSDGRVIFYRTETKTFYLPAIAKNSSGSSLITANSGASSGASSGAPNSSSSNGSSAGSGGTTSTSNYSVDVWSDLEKVAKTVGGSAKIVVNASVGSLTVTGTPPQVRNVEEWAKSLSDNLSQQISITVHIYKVKTAKEDNYSWNPHVVFKPFGDKYGYILDGPQTPPVVSGLAPLNLTANVLKTATGAASQFSGTQLAVEALSTLGQVSETLQQTVVTLNGQPAPLQVANQTSYLASTTQGAPTTIGATPIPPTLTPGLLTTGFTAMFLPRIVNGKILLAMNLTSSVLINMNSVSSGGSSIQTPNVDISTFQQSVTLTPGDSLFLTGLQKDAGSTNRSGVGTPNTFVLGGGDDSTTDKQLIAIVITAKVI